MRLCRKRSGENALIQRVQRTAEATAEPAAAEPEDETAAAEEQAPAAAEAVWNDTDGEGGMRRMLAIYKRELKSCFQSMVGCVFIAFLLAFTGIYFMAYNPDGGIPVFFLYTFGIIDRVYRRDPADHDAELFRRAEK